MNITFRFHVFVVVVVVVVLLLGGWGDRGGGGVTFSEFYGNYINLTYIFQTRT